MNCKSNKNAMAIVATLVAVMMVAVPLFIADSGDAAVSGTDKEYNFYLVNNAGTGSTEVNGWYTGYGANASYALEQALDAAGVTNNVTGSPAGYSFVTDSIADWASDTWVSDGDTYGKNFAIWNYNATDGWHLGNVVGAPCGEFQSGHLTAGAEDTVILVSLEKYWDPTGDTAADLGYSYTAPVLASGESYFTYTSEDVDIATINDAWSGPAVDIAEAYDTMDNALLAFEASEVAGMGYNPLTLANFGITKGGEYETVEAAYAAWKAAGTPAVMDATGLQAGYAFSTDMGSVVLRAPQDLAATPENTVFGPGTDALGAIDEIGIVTTTTDHLTGATVGRSYLLNFQLNEAAYTKASDYYMGYCVEIIFDDTALEMTSFTDAKGRTMAGTLEESITDGVFCNNCASSTVVQDMSSDKKLFTVGFKVLALDEGATTSVKVGVYSLINCADAEDAEGVEINSQSGEGATAVLYDCVSFVNNNAEVSETEDAIIPGDIVTVEGLTNSPAWAVYDPSCLTFVGVSEAKVGGVDTNNYTVEDNGEGLVYVWYNDGSEDGGAGMAFTLEFRVNENVVDGASVVKTYNTAGVTNPVIGSTDPATSFEMDSKSYDLKATAFVITPVITAGQPAEVSFYNLPDAAGFSMTFDTTGGAPVVKKLIDDGSMTISAADNSFTVVWTSPNGVDMDINKPLFSVSGADTYTRTGVEIRTASAGYLNVGEYDTLAAAILAVGGDPTGFIAGVPLEGDVDCDGDVDVYDLVMMKQFLVGKATLSDMGMANADVYGDDGVDLSDVMTLARMLATA